MKTADAKGFVAGITQYLEKEKPGAIPKVTALFGKLSSESEKESVAKVKSSVALTSDEQESIKRLLYKLTGRSVNISAMVDKTLIGGMKLSIGDWMVDTSITGQLDRLSRELLS